jgi:hypothetical protein
MPVIAPMTRFPVHHVPPEDESDEKPVPADIRMKLSEMTWP